MQTHPLWRPFEVPTQEQIDAARVGTRDAALVEVVDADPRWPAVFERVRRAIVGALGDRALAVEHVGSTAVPGLAAKPVIDIDVAVADPADEAAYLPDLETLGFVLRVREPDWEQHRMLRLVDPTVNLHVFAVGAVEPQRHVAFRNWLRWHDDDRDLYATTKREVAARGFTDAMHYNNAKAGVVYDIYERIFAADPSCEHTPQPR